MQKTKEVRSFLYRPHLNFPLSKNPVFLGLAKKFSTIFAKILQDNCIFFVLCFQFYYIRPVSNK